MAATYDETLATGKDWVRFLIRDTDTANAQLSDEEITALLGVQTATGEAAYYFAAAEALCILKTAYASAGAGRTSKSVEHLEITWGMDSGVLEALEYAIRSLRRRGAFLYAGRPYALRVVGRSPRRDVRFPTE